MASDDHLAYGDLFQWGRGDDGHQVVTWTSSTTGDVTPTTTTLSTTDVPGHGEFIRSHGDWRDPQNHDLWQGVDGINNPCPPGWRLPTEAELYAELLSCDPDFNATGAFNNSNLKWPVGGFRTADGWTMDMGAYGAVWSSSVSDILANQLYITIRPADIISWSRAHGMSVRCVRDI